MVRTSDLLDLLERRMSAGGAHNAMHVSTHDMLVVMRHFQFSMIHRVVAIRRTSGRTRSLIHALRCPLQEKYSKQHRLPSDRPLTGRGRQHQLKRSEYILILYNVIYRRLGPCARSTSVGWTRQVDSIYRLRHHLLDGTWVSVISPQLKTLE